MQKKVYRVFVEKKPEFAHEATFLLNDVREVLGVSSIRDLRIINRYDVELDDERIFNQAVSNVFSEPQVDTVA